MEKSAIPIIDTHIHLFDPSRPQGAPWPTKDDGILYQPALPKRYREIAVPLGVAGAIVVEASPWLEDNQWVLDLAAKDTMIVGLVGNLEPGKPGFQKNFERFIRDPLFLGIRFGNLWGRNLGAELLNPNFISDMKTFAHAGLVLDTADPNPALISDVVRLTDQVPSLRVVIDHLPQLDPPAESHALLKYQANLRQLAERPQVYVKVSEVLRYVGGRVPDDLHFYRPRLEELWNLFGEDRLLYGSDWPNSDLWAPYTKALSVVYQYFSSKGPTTAQKFLWRNSHAAYRWLKRSAEQPATN